VVLFADDTNLLITGKDECFLQQKITKVRCEVETWFQKNNLIINTEKTVAMSFHSKQMRLPLRPKVIFKNSEIVYKSELRFLGLCIVENLKWDAHTRTLSSKLCKVVYIIKSLKEIISSYMIKCIYYSKFQSCLKYGIIFWCGISESISIFKLQKRVIRIISGASINSSCRQIFKDYNILTVASLYILQVICFIKSIKSLWSITYMFILITCEENWIYMFSIATQFSSGKVL
jgi:hypothetical protein